MTEKIGLGGGCHWCTEAIYQSLLGVREVEQGWISAEEAPAFSEAVIVHYDPEKIALATLIEVHLHTHSCTSEHAFREKYRSAIYVFSKSAHNEANALLMHFQKDFDKKIQTRVYHHAAFSLNHKKYQNYYYSNPEKPFCKSRITPKLKLLLTKFGSDIVDPRTLPMD